MVGIKATKTGDWNKAKIITNTMVGAFVIARHKAMLAEAHLFRKEVVKGLRSGAPAGKKFAPLAPTTLAVRAVMGRGGKKPLIVSGALRNSIRVKQVTEGVFVGVLRSASGGRANVAEMHEFGSRPIAIPITAKSRRFLMMAFRRAGIIKTTANKTTIAIVRVRKRPFITPIAESALFKPSVIRKRFGTALAFFMGQKLGSV